MPRIHVCPLSQIAATVNATGARTLVTVINQGTPVIRPEPIIIERHLYIGMSDIVAAQDGHILPATDHVEAFLRFVRSWDQREAMVIHCYAGVSRSTASAFIAAAALRPDRDETALAQTIRRLSPTATPNARLVAVADDLLGRRGRMVDAIAAIGRGEDCFEGAPFSLAIAEADD